MPEQDCAEIIRRFIDCINQHHVDVSEWRVYCNIETVLKIVEKEPSRKNAEKGG